MATLKLTQGMRESVAEALMQHRFSKPQKEIAKRMEAIGDALYERCYEPEMQKLMALLPHGFMPVSCTLRVKYRRNKKDGVYTDAIPMSVIRRVAAMIDGLHLQEKDPVLIDYLELKDEAKRLRDERQEAKRKADAVLRSATTYNSLIQKWPEIEPFAKRLCQPVQRTAPLPVPTVAELNKTLGLPV